MAHPTFRGFLFFFKLLLQHTLLRRPSNLSKYAAAPSQRVSARDCRARKKEYVQDLERKVQYLEREHLEQLERIKQMSNRIAELEAHIRRQQTDQALWAAANLSLELDTSSSAGMGTDGG
eukprot:m.180767 g.180767  ORF g.180767 m.180767 type:complete len:120 (+) comp18432_c0_seq7:1254-1613(+)